MNLTEITRSQLFRAETAMTKSSGHLIKTGLLALLAFIGFDLFLHAGLLYPLYTVDDPFLLSPRDAFTRIPLGYLSFAILTFLEFWLMLRLGITGWQSGTKFGLLLGALIWGSFVLGLYSISTAGPALLAGWVLGQTAELGISGMVIGSGLASDKLQPLTIKVLILFALSVVLGIVIQNIWNVTI